MTLSFHSRGDYVPNPKEDPNASRWIASLSDGSTVFEDVRPGRSAWLRLRDYVELHKLKITNLRLEAYDRSVVLVPYKDGDGNPQLNGYWHSKRAGALMNTSEVIQVNASGVGILKNDEIWITWVYHDGSTREEIRPYKQGDLAVIVNDPPK